MASVTGLATAYDLTNGLKVSMDESIYMYDPMQLPLLNGLAADGQTVLSSKPLDQVEFNWLDERNLAPRAKVSATTAVATTDTTINLAADDGLKFSTGDTLVIRKAGTHEVIRVTGITADALTVTRALVGTAVNYAAGAVVIGVGTALAEGSNPENFRADDTNKSTNCTQIFLPSKMEMSGTARVVPRYGIPDQWAHQLYLRTYELHQAREQALMYQRYYNSTTTKIRTMGGIAHFITTNVDSTATQLTVANIDTNMQNGFNAGGVPDRLLVNPNSTKDLSDRGNTSIVRTTLDDARRGRVRVEWVQTEYGDLPLVRSRWVHPFDAFGIRRDNVTRRILRPLVFEALAKVGDKDSAMLVCEESLQVVGQKHMFRLAALAY